MRFDLREAVQCDQARAINCVVAAEIFDLVREASLPGHLKARNTSSTRRSTFGIMYPYG